MAQPLGSRGPSSPRPYRSPWGGRLRRVPAVPSTCGWEADWGPAQLGLHEQGSGEGAEEGGGGTMALGAEHWLVLASVNHDRK